MFSDQKRDLLLNVFYGTPPITSLKGIYDKVKKHGITYKEIKEFTKNQEVTQLYKRQPRIKYYFPIVAKDINEIWQIDLMDMSDIAAANNNIKYFFIAVDVFSRFASVVPMKNKFSKTVIDAMKETFKVMSGKPKILNCDNGSEFINNDFKKFVKENNIEVRYVEVGDHRKMSIAERFNRTLREKINKFLAIHHTTRYIDAFTAIVDNYNDSYHTGIKKAPREVTNNDESIIRLTNKKYNRALNEETKFKIGDEVRYIKNKTTFEKGSLPKWSKEIHEIRSKTEHTYTLDNNKIYKYYELMKVNDVDIPILQHTATPSREKLRKDNKVKRILRQENINLNDIVEGKRQVRRSTALKDYI